MCTYACSMLSIAELSIVADECLLPRMPFFKLNYLILKGLALN